MGLFGGPKKIKNKIPGLSAEGQMARGILYGDIERGMSGKGLYQDSWPAYSSAINSGYNSALPDIYQRMDHFLPQDETVKGFIRNSLSADKYSRLKDAKDQSAMEKYQEQQQSLGMAGNMANNIFDTSAAVTQANMQLQSDSFQRTINGITFGDQLGQGIGAGLAGITQGSQQANAWNTNVNGYRDTMQGIGYQKNPLWGMFGMGGTGASNWGKTISNKNYDIVNTGFNGSYNPVG